MYPATRRRPSRRLPATGLPMITAAATLLGLSALLVGCGGSDDGATATATPSSASSSDPGADTDGDRQAFADCLEKHGVELPSGAPSGGAPQSGEPQGGLDSEAIQACASLAPGGGGPGGGGDFDQSALDAFASCMQDKGVQVDAEVAALAGLDRSKPKVAAALETCEPLLPAAGSPAPTTS